MSVIMALRLKGDPAGFEEYANAHPEMADIKEKAVKHGLIAHRFFGAIDGSEVIVVDEWPDPESFQAFFSEVAEDVAQLTQAAGLSDEGAAPEFWRPLDTPDKHGWQNV